MKRNVFTAVAACIALFGTVWAAWPAPASEQVWSYQKLQPVDYRQLHSNALAFVTVKRRQGFELRARNGDAGPVSFEILCRGVQVLDVENTAARVVIRMPGGWADARAGHRRPARQFRALDDHLSERQLVADGAGGAVMDREADGAGWFGG